MFKLGKKVTHVPSGLSGGLTHYTVSGTPDNHTGWYIFQPGLLDKETGQPLDKIVAAEGVIKGGEVDNNIEIPVDILGSFAKDKITGFSGNVSELTVHINGCIHATVQPSGVDINGKMRKSAEFDLRSLEGKMIPQMNEEQTLESKKKKPSSCERPRLSVK